MCFTINKVSAKRNESGTNFGAILNKFKNEYLKYVLGGYPLSTMSSKKFTALTVKAIIDKPNNITRNVFTISIKKF